MSIIGSEWIGTAILILLGDGVVAAVLLNKSKAQNSGWIVITFGWGFAVMAGVYATAKFSGGQLNPAVTLGVWINGGITGGQAWHYWIGEFLGAMTGISQSANHTNELFSARATVGRACSGNCSPSKLSTTTSLPFLLGPWPPPP